MGWLKEKYTKEYFTQRDKDGKKLPYGVYGAEQWERGEMYDTARKILDLFSFKKSIVLDLGFGRGDAIKYCMEHGAKYVTGVDFSQPAYEIASKTLHNISERYCLFTDDALHFMSERSYNIIFV
jgi:cyclopropane fatty-acyl-phospholipid synthase-like methyltransferase